MTAFFGLWGAASSPIAGKLPDKMDAIRNVLTTRKFMTHLLVDRNVDSCQDFEPIQNPPRSLREMGKV
jgi:hypothetical protein